MRGGSARLGAGLLFGLVLLVAASAACATDDSRQWEPGGEFDRRLAAAQLKPGEACAGVGEAQLNEWYRTSIKLADQCLREDIWIGDGPTRPMTPEDRAWILVGRGAAYQYLEDRHRALADYGEAIRISPAEDRAYNNRGVLYRQMGECGLAIRDLDKAIALYPNDPAAYVNKARVLATCKDARFRDGSEAVRLAQKALTMDSSDDTAATLNAFAEAYAESGLFAAAVETEKKALTMQSSARRRLYWEQHLAAFQQNKPWRE
jgi:tetratricopeptide (TPR) repeat protein